MGRSIGALMRPASARRRFPVADVARQSMASEAWRAFCQNFQVRTLPGRGEPSAEAVPGVAGGTPVALASPDWPS